MCPARIVTGVRVNVAELARAQGLHEDFESLQRVRRGRGINGPDDLSYLSGYIKRAVLGMADDSEEALKRGLLKLMELVDRSPPHERELLKLCFNIDRIFGDFNWLERADSFALDHAWSGSSRSVRHQADVALLQLLMRSRPAAEIDPVPEPDARVPERLDRAGLTASEFFGEDYVRNSSRFIESWAAAESIDMCGFGHNRMAVAYSAEIGRVLRTGGRVRVLMQDPEGQAVLDANRRSSTPKASADAVRHQHRSGIATFNAIVVASGSLRDALQMRMYDIMPPFTAYFFDSDTASAHAYVWFWSWRQPSAWRPGFLVSKASDSLWHERFRSQFEAMWTDEGTRPVGEEDPA